MNKAAVITLLGLAAPAAAGVGGCDKYLLVTLADSFGDGWGDARWELTDPSLSTSTVSLDCDEDQKVFAVMPDDFTPSTGTFSMTVGTVDGDLPANWWEMYWKVEEFDTSGSTGVTYEGTYGSVMTWDYSCSTTDSWDLTSALDLPDFSCTGCSGSKCADVKRGPAGKKNRGKKGPIKGGKGKRLLKGKRDDDAESIMTNSSDSNSEEKYGKRNTDLKVKMYADQTEAAPTQVPTGTPSQAPTVGTPTQVPTVRAPTQAPTVGTPTQAPTVGTPTQVPTLTPTQAPTLTPTEAPTPGDPGRRMLKRETKQDKCDGWAEETVIGAHWYISDVTQTELFDDGALCNGCAGSCDICLGDGSYVFRVTGANQGSSNDTDVKVWDFCHGRGYFNEQMNFHVKKGECYPDDLRWSDETCDDQVSNVMVFGVVALGGIPSEFFANKAQTVVLDTLAKTIEGWNTQRMAVTATSLDTRALTSGDRMLQSYTHDVEFSVSFHAEDFSVNGASYSDVENLLADMASTLEASFNTGVFSDLLSHEANIVGVDLFQSITAVELVSLEISHIDYAISHLVYYYGDDESVSVQSSSSASLSNNIVMVIVGVCALGFVAFVGIARHGMGSYAKLNTATDSEVSERAAAEISMPVLRSPFGANVQGYKPVQAVSI